MQKDRRKFLRKLAGTVSVAGLTGMCPLSSHAGSGVARINNIRLSRHAGYIRLVFDLDRPIKHSVFALNGPERVVLDLQQVSMSHGLVDQVDANALIRGIRSGVRNGDDLRVVFDMDAKVKPRSFQLGPSGDAGHRLVLDLHDTRDAFKVTSSQPVQTKKLRDVVIAIDAGHGGRDPGATGRNGTKEKTITLQIAKKLQKVINGQSGMKAVLTRTNDRFMKLRDRIEKAKDNKADMMISLHADSFPDQRARGSSIYALSVDGASSETAKQLADNENAADVLFGDVSVAVNDKAVKEVLFDLSLTGTIQSSLDIGDEVIRQIRTVNRVHKRKVQQADFAVLKTPNIPSVLLETAFISNPREEKNLRSSAHQTKVAKAIGRGVSSYFSRKAPPGTWLSEARTKYKVRSGDTLGSIASHFDTSVENLRARNALHTSNLSAGQVLKIPVS